MSKNFDSPIEVGFCGAVPENAAESLPAAPETTPRCPQCKNPLEKVRYPATSMLNEDQFMATRAGDWFCKCHTNQRGNRPYAYFWSSEVEPVAPVEAKEKNRMTYEETKQRFGLPVAEPKPTPSATEALTYIESLKVQLKPQPDSSSIPDEVVNYVCNKCAGNISTGLDGLLQRCPNGGWCTHETKAEKVISTPSVEYTALDAIRDAVLHERFQLAEMSAGNDVINAVLGIIDDLWPHPTEQTFEAWWQTAVEEDDYYSFEEIARMAWNAAKGQSNGR